MQADTSPPSKKERKVIAEADLDETTRHFLLHLAVERVTKAGYRVVKLEAHSARDECGWFDFYTVTEELT